MEKVSTAELKAHMGVYLARVQEGETLYVTSHRRPVARLSPSMTEESLSILPPTLPMSELKKIEGVRLPAGVDGVAELLKDRQRR